MSKAPIDKVSKTYEKLGHQIADCVRDTYQDGVRYGSQSAYYQMDRLHDWSRGGWDFLYGFWLHHKAANIAIAHGYYASINFLNNYPAEAMARYYEDHDHL